LAGFSVQKKKKRVVVPGRLGVTFARAAADSVVWLGLFLASASWAPVS